MKALALHPAICAFAFRRNSHKIGEKTLLVRDLAITVICRIMEGMALLLRHSRQWFFKMARLIATTGLILVAFPPCSSFAIDLSFALKHCGTLGDSPIQNADFDLSSIMDLNSALTQHWYGQFGQCRMSPKDASELASEWSEYRANLEKKIKLNIPALDQMPTPESLRDYIGYLKKLGPILLALNRIKDSRFMKDLYSDPNFETFSQSQVFSEMMTDRSLMDRSRNTNFVDLYQHDPAFKSSIDKIENQLKDPDIQKAIEYFRQNDLSFVSPTGLASALRLYRLYKDIDPGGIRYLKDLEKPRVIHPEQDPFGEQFSQLMTDEITRFLKSNRVQAGPGLDRRTAEILNKLTPPNSKNPYYDRVAQPHYRSASQEPFAQTVFGKEYEVNPHQIAAIDGVARTLWGEARSCQQNHMAQFEAIGLVIANRTAAVSAAMNESKKLSENDTSSPNRKIAEKNKQTLLNQKPDESFLAQLVPQLRGMADFGIPDSKEDPAAQVISRPRQFSVWNSFITHNASLSSLSKHLPAGIPDIQIELPGQLPQLAELSQLNVLCPWIESNVGSHGDIPGWPNNPPAGNDDNWKRAVDLSALIVLDPDRYREMFRFDPPIKGEPIMFYTHGPNLPFAIERRIGDLIQIDPDSGKPTHLRIRGGTGSCGHLRLFSARAGIPYGISPLASAVH